MTEAFSAPAFYSVNNFGLGSETNYERIALGKIQLNLAAVILAASQANVL